MELFLELFEMATNPDWIVKRGGLYLVLIILFVETGLFFGFFLPGDPLLFLAGMIIAGAENSVLPFDREVFNLLFWMLLFASSTILGYMVGYWSGHQFSAVFKGKRRRIWFLKSEHIDSAKQFYFKRGGGAILIARFLPVVRTFIPIVGGLVKMKFSHFMLYNILGATLWVGLITTMGYWLGENAWVAGNLEWIILGLVVIVTAPVIFKFLEKKRSANHIQKNV